MPPKYRRGRRRSNMNRGLDLIYDADPSIENLSQVIALGIEMGMGRLTPRQVSSYINQIKTPLIRAQQSVNTAETSADTETVSTSSSSSRPAPRSKPTRVINLSDFEAENRKKSEIDSQIDKKLDTFLKNGGLLSSDEEDDDIPILKKAKNGSETIDNDDKKLESNTNTVNEKEAPNVNDVDEILSDFKSYQKETEDLIKSADDLLKKYGKNDDESDDKKPEPEAKEKGLGECPVCYDPFTSKQVISTKCGHLFCNECIEQICKGVKKCPTCRKPVNQKTVIQIYI